MFIVNGNELQKYKIFKKDKLNNKQVKRGFAKLCSSSIGNSFNVMFFNKV